MEKIKIAEIAESYAGGTPSRDKVHYFGGSIPWIKSTEVNRRRISSTEESITDEGLLYSAAKWIPADSILIALYGATAAQISYLEIKATSNQAVLAVLPKNANAKYLYYAITFAKHAILYQAQGSGQPNLNKAIIDSTEIHIPKSLIEQQKIAEVLSTVDRRLSRRRG